MMMVLVVLAATTTERHTQHVMECHPGVRGKMKLPTLGAMQWKKRMSLKVVLLLLLLPGAMICRRRHRD